MKTANIYLRAFARGRKGGQYLFARLRARDGLC